MSEKHTTNAKHPECLSMTGYAQARHEKHGWAVRVTVKSVNHRFLDLKMRLPEGFDLYDLRLRQIVRERIHRGHLEIYVNAEPGTAAPVQVNKDRKSTRLNSSHSQISYAVFCLKKKNDHLMIVSAYFTLAPPPDRVQISHSVIMCDTDCESALNNNKHTTASQCLQRSRFTTALPTTMTPAQFVDQLNQNAGGVLSMTDRNMLFILFGNVTNTSIQTPSPQALRHFFF